MLTHARPVYENFGILKDTLELQKILPLRNSVLHFKMASIPAISDIKLRGAEVGDAEGVWEVDVAPVRIVKTRLACGRLVSQKKLPSPIQVGSSSRPGRLGKHRKNGE